MRPSKIISGQHRFKCRWFSGHSQKNASSRSDYLKESVPIVALIRSLITTGLEIAWSEQDWVACSGSVYLHGENFMAIFTTHSVVIWFSTGTLGDFATLVYVFAIRVVLYDILTMAIIPTLSTFILFCNLCYILLWISQRSVVKIAIRI